MGMFLLVFHTIKKNQGKCFNFVVNCNGKPKQPPIVWDFAEYNEHGDNVKVRQCRR